MRYGRIYFFERNNAFSGIIMEKKYTYENGIIYISIPDEQSNRIRNATEQFLRRVVSENEQYDFGVNINNSETRKRDPKTTRKG